MMKALSAEDRALKTESGWPSRLTNAVQQNCSLVFGALRPSDLSNAHDGRWCPKLATSTVSAAATSYYLLSAFLIVFVSDAIAKFGPRLVATAGTMMLGISLILVSHITSTIDLFVAYLAMAPAFATLTNAAIANILGLWFVKKGGLPCRWRLVAVAWAGS